MVTLNKNMVSLNMNKVEPTSAQCEESTLHTSAREAALSIFDAESELSLSVHIKFNGVKNSNVYPQKVVERRSKTSHVTYFCRKSPFPFAPREWLTTVQMREVEGGVFEIACKSVTPEEEKEIPAYSHSRLLHEPVRGEITSLSTLTPLPFGQCLFKLTAKVDVKGNAPNLPTLSNFLNLTKLAAEYFSNEAEIDKRERDHFISSSKNSSASVTERNKLLRCLSLADLTPTAGAANPNTWTRIQDAKNFSTKCFTRYTNGDSLVWAKSEATVHAGAEDVLAFCWQYCSNFRMKQHKKKEGNLVRKILDHPRGGHIQGVMVQKLATFGFDVRESRMEYIWDRFNLGDDDGFFLALGFLPLRSSRSSTRRGNWMSGGGKVVPAVTADSIIAAGAGGDNSEDEEEMKGSVTQLWSTGIWVVKPLSRHISQVTYVINQEDTGTMPVTFVNMQTIRSLDVVNSLKSYFERNGAVVDHELRDAFVAKIPTTIANDEQRRIITEQVNQVDVNSPDWTLLDKYTCPMMKVYSIHTSGEHKVWNKVEVAVDTCAEDVLAFIWDYCSNERIKSTENPGENPRELLGTLSSNQCVVSTVKSMPWPIFARQFTVEFRWMKGDDGSYVWSHRPYYEPDICSLMNTGNIKKTTRGESMALAFIKPASKNTCNLVFCLHNDAKGYVPPSVAAHRQPRAVYKFCLGLREKFARDSEIDAVDLSKMMSIMRDDIGETYSISEQQTLDRAREKLGSIDDDLFRPLDSPDFRTKMSIAHRKGEPNGVLRCELTVDASVEGIAAYCFNLDSRERRKFRNRPELAKIRRVNNHTLENLVVKEFKLGVFAPRFFLNRRIWQRTNSGGIVYVGEDILESPLLKEIDCLKYSPVRASNISLISFEKSAGSSLCTNMSCTFQINLRGAIPSSLVDISVTKFLHVYSQMRERFSRDYEVDAASRREIMALTLSNEEDDEDEGKLTGDEINDIKRFHSHLERFQEKKEIQQHVRTDLPGLITAVGCVVDTKAWCQLNASVQCSAEEALAFLLDISSRSLLSSSDVAKEVISQQGHTREVKVVEENTINNIRFINESRRRMVWTSVDDDYFCANFTWKRGKTISNTASKLRQKSGSFDGALEDRNEILLFAYAHPGADDSTLGSTQRRQSRRQYRRQSLSRRLSRLTGETAGATLPKKQDRTVCCTRIVQRGGEEDVMVEMIICSPLTSLIEIERDLPNLLDYRTLKTMLQSFCKWKPLNSLNANDGRRLGMLLSENVSGLVIARKRTEEAKRKKVEFFFTELASMKTLKGECIWFESMCEAIILGTYTAVRPQGFERLELLDKSDGLELGRNFTYQLGRAATENGAVDRFLKSNPAMMSFSEKNAFFVPLLTAVGKAILHAKTWHKLLLSAGTALSSIFDVGSDIYTIFYYRSIGLVAEADAMLTFLVGSLVLQVSVVLLLHHKSKRRMLIELAGTLTLTKMGMNWWNVLTNKKMEGHEIVPAVSEMFMFMVAEIFAECIPMTILQVNTFLLSEETDAGVVLSLIISLFFVADSISYLSYRKDIDDKSRQTGRLFYGFMPLHGIGLVMVNLSMRMISVCQLLGKSVAVVILFHVGGRSLVLIFLGVEMGIYLLWKLARGEFRYWLPLTSNAASFFISFFLRVIVKIVTDFTGMLHARHPFEMGGAYWLFNIFFTQATLFFAATMLKAEKEGGSALKIDGDNLLIFTAYLFSTWLAAILTLLTFCERGFRHTFYQLTTAPQHNKKLFDSADGDEVRMRIFGDHKSYYQWYEGEIREWLNETWDDLNAEKPPWFTNAVIARIPLDYIPNASDADDPLLISSPSTRSVRLGDVFSGLGQNDQNDRTNGLDEHARVMRSNSISLRWCALAETICSGRSQSATKNIEMVDRLFTENRALVKHLLQLCPRISTICGHMLVYRFGMKILEVSPTSTPKSWTSEDCRRVGRSVATLLRTRGSVDSAMLSWRQEYRQLDTLFDGVEGFEDFATFLLKEIHRRSSRGMVYRVGLGAFISSVDSLTDIYVTVTYMKGRLWSQAIAMLAMISTNIFIQIIIVVGNYAHCSRKKKLKEILISLSFMRPIVDAYRVSIDGREDKSEVRIGEERVLNPLTEMIANKGAELGTESIPGCVLQMAVLLGRQDKLGGLSFFSIVISSLTTGYTSAMLSFDMDTDTPHRRLQKRFYGYIKSNHRNRGNVFILLMVMATLHNFSRSLGCALLAVSNPNALLFFLGGEHLLYITYRLCRRDFINWMRLGDGILGASVSFFMRVLVKVIVDFSGCVHFRHPYELGGAAFTVSLVWAQVFPFVALTYYSGEMREDLAFLLYLCLGVWLAVGVVFFCTIDRRFISTFFDTKSGPQYATELFLTGEEEELKFDAVFTVRPSYTKSVHEEVRTWVATYINDWIEDRPAWFQLDLIDDEFLSKEILEKAGGHQRKRRRSSLSNMLT